MQDEVSSRIRCIEADLTQSEHRRAVADLVNMYAQEPLARGGALPADVLERLPEFLQKFPTAHVYLARDAQGDENRPQSYLGIAVCVLTFSTFAAAPMMNIHDIAVRPAHRGRGIGRALLGAVERSARALGCVRLSLEVHRENIGAIAAYRQFGFADGERTDQPGTIWYFVKQL